MPGKQSKTPRAAAQRSSATKRNGQRLMLNGDSAHKTHIVSEMFSRMACETARLTGKPIAFLAATATVLIWGASGPLFGFSDTWQLVINTSTTIVTFLMVFLIQHTQNRDTMALQLKLAELIITMQGAENKVAIAEDMNEEDLERMHEVYRARAEETLVHLTKRRGEPLEEAS